MTAKKKHSSSHAFMSCGGHVNCAVEKKKTFTLWTVTAKDDWKELQGLTPGD